MNTTTFKNDIKKCGILVLLVLLMAPLTACSSQSNSTQVPEQVSEAKKDGEDNNSKPIYTSILKDLYDDHVLPDGKAFDWNEDSDISQNLFSVYDIDQDGNDELIIVHSEDVMAGMVELIYNFDSNTQMWNEMFREFPTVTYYDNGIIRADWSHNQGLAGEFWPYTLYQYDRDSDVFINIGMVDAWDRSLSEVDYNGNPFPTEADIDGDGIVYYIMQSGEYKLEEPKDVLEYERWINTYIGDAAVIDVPFMNLTKENILEIESSDS